MGNAFGAGLDNEELVSGIRQGDVLSPYLSAIYVDSVVEKFVRVC